MAISIFDLFTVGIGPSSSHTVGPMRAAKRFVERLERSDLLASLQRLRIELYGSLSATGRGHGTDHAILMGLQGCTPEDIEPDSVGTQVKQITQSKQILLGGRTPLHFEVATDLVFLRNKRLPLHSNGMLFRAFDAAGAILQERVYYSVGGGFVVDEVTAGEDRLVPDHTVLPFVFNSGADMLRLGLEHGKRLPAMVLQNETTWRTPEAITAGLLQRWEIMQQCVKRACGRDGVLPGGLKVRRRAHALHAELRARATLHNNDSLGALDWVNLYALAVNEENAAGGRVVTAPTNGAAGIIPAVLHYYAFHSAGSDNQGIVDFLLTAGAIGILYKERASISGAEVGCQGEVGVACSMAAAGLVAALGGTNAQMENAAEIGMEHNLGLTCDPVGGLVQIPCIERNAMGAVKAINAARMALRGDGSHKVSLDRVIETMRQTGADMRTKYKETSRGGLAINVIEC
jgi:L-serine dehydratase